MSKQEKAKAMKALKEANKTITDNLSVYASLKRIKRGDQ